MKQLIIILSLLTLYTIIFIFLFQSKKKTGKNLHKIYKRQLDDFSDTDNLISDESDIDTNPNTDIDTNIVSATDTHITTDINIDNNTNTETYPTYDTYDTVQETTYFITEDINTTNIFNNCSAVKFFKTPCHPDNKNKEDDTEYINHIIDQIQDGKFKELFNKMIEEDINYIKKENNITYQISTISSQNNTNLSKVSLEKRESILKDVYSIDIEEKLILLKLEHNVENIKIPIGEYQLFTKDGQKLNLSYCNSIPELVSIPVDIEESEEFIHDPNNDFYHDKCYIYNSEYHTDLTLYDRKNNFNKKFLSLCEKNCTHKG